MHFRFTPRSVLLPIAVALMAIYPAIVTPAWADEILSHLSPDGTHALRKGEQWEVVKLPSGSRVMELPWAEDSAPTFMWAPDGKHFAIYEEEGTRVGAVHVYRMGPKGFATVNLPDLTMKDKRWDAPKGWRGNRAREYVSPVRWLADDQLLLERNCSEQRHEIDGDGEEDWGVSDEIVLRCGSKGRPTIQSVKEVKPKKPPAREMEIRGPAQQPGLPDAFALGFASRSILDEDGASDSPDGNYRLLSPRLEVIDPAAARVFVVRAKPFTILAVLGAGETQRLHPYLSHVQTRWAANSSAVLVQWNYTDEPLEAESVAAELIEFHDNRVVRMTQLHTAIRKLLLPHFERSGAEAFRDATPFVMTCDLALDGNGKVHMVCDAASNPTGDSETKSWLARASAVWNIKEAKFTDDKVAQHVWTTP